MFLTDSRLLFEPNRFDAITGGCSWGIGLDHIAEVDVLPKNMVPIAGALRDHLLLLLDNGVKEEFVVNRLKLVIAKLTNVVEEARGRSKS